MLHPQLIPFRAFLQRVWQVLGLPKPTEIQLDYAYFLEHGIDPTKAPHESPNDRLFGGAFRGMGKSWITAAFVVHQLALDPQSQNLVVSASKGHADDMSSFMMEIIETVPEVQFLKPRPNQRQSKVKFDVAPAKPSKAASVASYGIFGQLVGTRADLIIADDVETDQNASTQGGREKLKQAVKQFDAIIKPGGRIIYLGTPQTEQSIYNDLPERGYTRRLWPARYPELPEGLLDDARDLLGLGHGGDQALGGDVAPVLPTPQAGHHLLDSGVLGGLNDLAPFLVLKMLGGSVAGASTEPTRFDDADLLAREASWGRSGFALQYLLDTSLSDAHRYPLKLSDLIVMDLDVHAAPDKVVWGRSPELEVKDVTCVGFNGDRYYRPAFLGQDLLAYEGAVLFVDPSGRGKDDTGVAVTKMLHGQIFVAEVLGLPGGYETEALKRIAEAAKLHSCHKILVESNFGDGMFEELLRPVVNKIYPCTVEGVRHNQQKELRIIDTLEPVMNQHRLVMNRSVIEHDTRPREGEGVEASLKKQLFYQMTRITRDRGALAHDDLLDALAGAVAYWTDRMAQDIDRAVQVSRDRALEGELQRFMQHVVGRPTSASAPSLSRGSSLRSRRLRRR